MTIQLRRLVAILLATVGTLAFDAAAQRTALAESTTSEVVGWRTDGTGRYPDAQPPLEWSSTKEGEKNIVWKAELPSRSHSSPVIVGERVFVTAEPDLLMCFDRADGKLLWQAKHDYEEVFGPAKAQEIAEQHAAVKPLEEKRKELRKELSEYKKSPGANEEGIQIREQNLKALEAQIDEVSRYPALESRGPNGYTTSTPVSNGQQVFALFGHGVTAAYTLDGERQWVRFIEKPTIGFGHSGSPALIDGLLITHLEELVALNAATGEEAWRTQLPARHASCITARIGDTGVIITPGGAIVRAKDGHVLTEKLFHMSNASPIIHEDVLYALEEGKIKAYRLPQAVSGDTLELEMMWEGDSHRQRSFASPVAHNGLIYAVTESGILDIIDASNGENMLRKRLDFGGRGRVFASVALVGDLIFIGADNGTILMLKPGTKYEEAQQNEVESFTSCPVAEGDKLFIRGREHLLCIGK